MHCSTDYPCWRSWEVTVGFGRRCGQVGVEGSVGCLVEADCCRSCGLRRSGGSRHN